MVYCNRKRLAGLVLSVMAGCATSGTGSGELVNRSGATQDQPVPFTWHSSMDHLRGDMSATLPDGQTYSGNFFEITSTTQADTLTPLWDGWSPWWGDWGGISYAGPEFVTHYSGKVLATLTGPNGARMRCNFQLADPPRGMASGGQGQCQLKGGRTINATFPKV